MPERKILIPQRLNEVPPDTRVRVTKVGNPYTYAARPGDIADAGSPDNVTSVAGKTGDVVLDHNDITDWDTAVAPFENTVDSVAGKTGDVVLNHNDITDWNPATANFAPKNSPVFTGDPRSVTPPAGDVDTSIATTAFVAIAISGVVGGSGGGIPEAPTDGNAYGRQNAGWMHVIRANDDIVDGGNF